MLEFYLKMKDMMSSGLAKVAATAKETFAKVKNAADHASAAGKQGFDKMKSSIVGTNNSANNYSKTLGSLYDRMKDLKNFRMDDALGSKAIKQATRDIQGLEKQINKLEGRKASGRSGGGVMSMIGRQAAGLLPAVGLAGLLSFGTSSVKAAMDFDVTKKSFEVLTGNRQTGNELTEKLRGLKQNTIMGASVYKNAQTMLGYGISSEKVIPQLKMIGDVSMGDADKQKRLSLALGQVTAQGKLKGQDNLQFINAGFNPLQEMARTTGKSMADLTDMMKKGKISVGMVEDAFKSATGTGGRFSHMMEKIGETTAGRLKRIEGQYANLKIKVGEALMPIANGMLTWASNILTVIQGTEKLSETLTFQKTEITGLVGAITSLNEGNALRKTLLQDLLNKYPDFFKGLDAETAKNGDLLKVLSKVNGEYDKRIKKAGNSELHDSYKNTAAYADDSQAKVSTVLSFMKEGKYKEAQILANKYLPGMSNNQFTSEGERNRTIKILERLAKSTGATSKENNRLDFGVTVDDNKNFINDELNPFRQNKKMMDSALKTSKLKAAFDNEYKKMYSSIGYKDGKANPELLGKYDFSKLKELMNPGLSPKNIKVPGTDEDGEGGSKKHKSKGAASGSNAIASSITGGGPRVINISGVKFCDKVELHAATVKENVAELENVFNDMFLRVLNSGASVQ